MSPRIHFVFLVTIAQRQAFPGFPPHSFFSGCHLFIPLFDPAYDTYEGVMDRSPWTFDAILAIAAKIRSGNAPLGATFYKCLEEAQGIARSSLFGPIVRKEAVMGAARARVCLLGAHVCNVELIADYCCFSRYASPCSMEYKRLASERARNAHGT
jgi:hypothetical protein